uniref:Rhodanese domain-containing protein n=1 Tax=viral metagenome TaxID=1070528 RepID=A0A6C0C4C3_9ZZZZ
MGKICLTCEVTKSMNQAELEKVIPDWYKEIGNYSLLPPFLNNNDKYNANKRTLQILKPNITNYEVNIKVEDKPNTWICYWAAEYTKDFMKIKSAKDAYNTFKNHGLVKTNSKGLATFVLNCPQPYSVDDITYPRHVHYCLLNRDNFWSDNIKTLIVSCKINFEIMRKYVNDKCHILFNALPKENFNRCHIPNSYSLSVSLLDKSSSKEKQNKVKQIIHRVIDNYPSINKSLKSKKITIYNLPIVVYCAHSKCHASEKLIEHLIDAGFVNILEYPGGTKEWKLKEKTSMPDTCFFSDEGQSGGKIQEINIKLNESDDKEDNKGSKTDKKKLSKSKKKDKDDLEKVEDDVEEEDEVEEEVKEEVEKEVEEVIKRKKTVNNEYDLYGKQEKLIYEDIIYNHDVETDEIFNKSNENVGTLKGINIEWNSNEDKKNHISAKENFNEELISSSEDDDNDSSDDSSSSDEEIFEDIKNIKKDVDNIKYRKHKLSLKCMNDVTPKVYNEKFRGWGFTYWG